MKQQSSQPGQAPPMPSTREVYISVDVETAGPNPSLFSLLSIGACLVFDPDKSFYAELEPLTMLAQSEAMAVHGLSLTTLAAHGLPPQVAMKQFETWVHDVCQQGRPVFVGLNAAFDWMFVNDYFHRFLGHNRFGHAPLDMKAFYMGRTGLPWDESNMKHMLGHFGLPGRLTHQARQDALDQAHLFRLMLAEPR